MSEERSSIPFPPLALLGFTCYNAWLFFVIAPLTIGSIDDVSPWTRLPIFIALLVVLILGRYFSDFFFKRRAVLYVLCAVCAFFPLSAMLIPSAGYGFHLFSYIFMGVGYSCSFLLWSEYLCILTTKQTQLFTSLGIALGAVLGMIAILLPFYPRNILAAFIVLANVAVISFMGRRYPQLGPDRVFIPGKVSDERMDIDWRPIVTVVAGGIALGFAVKLLAFTSDNPLIPLFICTGAFVLAGVILYVDVRTKGRIDESFCMKLFLPACAIGLFPLFTEQSVLQLICGGIMLCAMILENLFSASTLCQLARVFQLAPMRVYAYGRSFAAFGLLIGWTLGCLAEASSSGRLFMGGVSLALVFLFIFLSSFVLENRYPTEANATGEADIDDKHLSDSDISPKDTDAYFGNSRHDVWRHKQEKVAETFGLSPRQNEILALLSRGRDTKYIQEKLQISSHTVKAHVYTVYQKTGVHSRQELIDLIESMDVEEDSERQ